MIRFVIVFLIMAHAAAAQKIATVESFSIHHAKDDDEDVSSEFPIVHSTNATADTRINNFLQNRFLGKPLDEKSKSSVGENFDPRGDRVFSYSSQITERFVGIVIKKYHVNNGMSLNGYDESFPFLFDARSGQQFSPLALFSEEGTTLFLGKAFRGLRESYLSTMDRYVDGFSKLKTTAQKEQCGCDCEGMLQDVFRNGLAVFSVAKDGITVTMDGCVWQNPGPHDQYSTLIAMSELRPWLSSLGKFMVDGGSEPGSAPQFMLFQGTLEGNISTSFVLRRDSENKLSGYEIYNRVGSTIKLGGTLTGKEFTFDEISPEGKSVATFKATLDGNRLSGKWTKSDGSRTLTFYALMY